MHTQIILGSLSGVKWMGGSEGHFRTVKIRENASQCNDLPLSPPAPVSAQITEAFSVRRSTRSVEPRPGTFVCTGQHLQSTNIQVYIDIQNIIQGKLPQRKTKP